MSSSEPPQLLGRPVAIDENLPAIAGNSYPILFGDFSRGYVIVERAGLKLLGGLADCDAIRVLKVATS